MEQKNIVGKRDIRLDLIDDFPNHPYHVLRHSCASLLIANGVSLKEIQDGLGHSDYGTTANIYSHLEYSAKVNSANKIAEKLSLK